MSLKRAWWKKIAMAAMLAMGICLPSYGCSSGSGTLRVGVRADIQYWGYYNEKNGKYYGLEIDLARDLAKKLGYKDVAFTTVDPTNREQMLEDDQVDAIIACYSITDERAKVVDFSPVYFTDHVEVLTMESTLFTKLSDIVGLNIAYVAGTDAKDKLIEKMESDGLITAADMKGTTFTEYSTYPEIFVYLATGLVDASVTDGSIATDYMNSGLGLMALDEYVTDENYAVATQKGSKLSARMTDAVNALLKDGTVAALIKKWY